MKPRAGRWSKRDVEWRKRFRCGESAGHRGSGEGGEHCLPNVPAPFASVSHPFHKKRIFRRSGPSWGQAPWRALGDEPLGTAVGDRHVPAGWSGAGALGTGMWGEGCWTGAVGEVAVGTDTAQAVEDGARTVGRAPGVSPHLAPAMGTCTTLGAVGVGLSAHPQSAAPASDWGQAMGDRPIRSSDGGQAHTLVHTLVHTLDIL